MNTQHINYLYPINNKLLKPKSTTHVVCLSILGKKLALIDGKVSDPWVGKTPWRIPWQPTLVLLPGESHSETWWAMVQGALQSQTWLQQLSIT